MMAAEPSRASQRRPVGSRLARAVSLALLASCGPGAPTWIELATLAPERVRIAHGTGDALEATPLELGELDGRPVRLVMRGRDAWFEEELRPEDWRAAGPEACVTRLSPVLPSAMAPLEKRDPGDGVSEDLFAPGTDFRPAEIVDLEHGFRAEPGRFLRVDEQLQLRVEAGAGPPETAHFGWRVTHGERTTERFVVRGRRVSGDGFSVPPGTRCELRFAFPPDSVLRFATASETLLPGAAPARQRFGVRLNGVGLFTHEQEVTEAGSIVWHEVPLPRAGSEESHLWLEVEGDIGYAAFLAPTIAPADVGAYRARPWGARRPDLVLFLADTLRADGLSVFDAPAAPFRPAGVDLTPRLDAFAAEARAFTNARSVSTWTLPTMSTLFTGLYPHQTGLTDAAMALPAAAHTLAERLQGIGYRTAAVTEGGFVSTQHGFARGFGTFWEGSPTLERTVRSALDAVAADDGRPLFLVVHTFETHTPYDVSRETRERVGAALGIRPDDDYEILWEAVDEWAGSPDMQAAVRALYLGEIADLDRAFGGFHDALTEAGVLPGGYLLFTSDHGEAFGEHGQYWHTGKPHEELVRVPLVLQGPRVPTGVDRAPASLVDVVPTFLDLVGLPRPEEQPGTSLFELDEDRPVYAFECGVVGESGSHVAVVDGARKVIGAAPGGVLADRAVGAYDLGADPSERRNLEDEPWTLRLLERHADAVQELSRPRYRTNEMPLDPLRRAELEALGYVDG